MRIPALAALTVAATASSTFAFQSAVPSRCLTPQRDPDRFQSQLLPPGDCAYGSNNPSTAYEPSTGDLYEIPVVFHVIQNSGGTGFIGLAQIQTQIDILNEDFRALGGTPGSPGYDSKIQFVLATTDPGGGGTTGVTYSTNDNWFNDNGSYWNSLAWDPNNYLNIYTNNGGGALGYVPDIPQGGVVGSSLDRVVVLWSTVGRNAPYGPPYNQGRTVTHEVGHYLGLYHTFDGGCGTSACSTTGDLICDTNRESSPNYSCGGGSSCGSPDPIANYMNYTDDVCMSEFTQEQGRRMRCTLEGWRSNLYSIPGGGGEPLDPAPAINIDVGVNGTFGVPASSAGAASGQAGSWASVNNGSGSNLVGLDGLPTLAAVSVSGNGNGDFEQNNTSTSGNVQSLLDDLYDANNSTFTLTGMENGAYDVYVYSWAPDNRTAFVSSVTVQGGAAGAQLCGGAGWTGSWVQGAQYVVDTVTTNNGTIAIDVAQTGGNPSSLNGIQVVPSGGGGRQFPAFCDGSDNALFACPCLNIGAADAGCDNSAGTGGVALAVSAFDGGAQTAVVTGTGYPPAGTPTAVLIRATNVESTPVVFGDGVRCIGLQNFTRLAATSASGGFALHNVSHGAGPGTFNYQAWYRNTPNFCLPEGFNLSNGRSITW